MKLVDTHIHLYLDRFEEDLDAVVKRAHAQDVKHLVLPAIDLPSIEQAVALCEKYEGMYAMAALHPSDTKTATDQDFERIVDWCDHPAIIAVGESGLDYYWDRSFDEIQHDFFRRHIKLAAEKDLPLILHNRDASEDLVRILKEERARLDDPARLKGIFHCFGGPTSLAFDAIEMGFMIGLGGTLTFKNSGVAAAVESVPLEHIVLETDAPFLAPVPYRGKRNEPAYVRLVAEKLASVKGVSLEEVARITTENASRIFKRHF